ncbi:uncharacterized protein LOC121381132 [Gigantopelta aegis]|uniref:uncharacterized protein LOC121381132 n=1 Tax=Gigantopelta aegis TaxID=1735272 RepID=UPI001B889E9B|nr:uncharacterized protein LOC121381132 [Gigantopelta aegis]
MHCLVKADGMGCSGTTKRSAVATTLYGLIDDNCKTGLTGTCNCSIAYAKTDTTDKTNKCTAAKTATTCLEAIKSTEEKACDGSTLTKTYLNETITPIVTEACSSGTVMLLSVWVAAACVLSGMIQQ